MKTNLVVSLRSIVMALMLAIFVMSCQTNEPVTPQQDLLPQKFSVNIPSAISTKSTVAGGRVKGDTLNGNAIYLNLGTFIAVGKGASEIVEAFINGIRAYHIDRVKTLTYSGDDNRSKNLVVLSQVEFGGHLWDYALTITDADSEGNADGGKALQLFWNNEAPIKGIAIIKPFNCDRTKNSLSGDSMFRIDYSEGGEHGYDAEMEVRISDLPLTAPGSDKFAIGSLHMFAGRKGDVVDVFGNSNHPNANLFTADTGFNWAFVAASNEKTNIAVAEVGLPPSSLDSNDRQVLLKDYSVHNVFVAGITAIWPGIDQTLLNSYLSNTAAPGYFNSVKGFLSGGNSPGADFDVLAARLDGLSPYNPLETSNLHVVFK
ncbi:MAG: hypothetical protein K1X47_01340 [Cyclobacteriaceae bacterium]|nr:hypothetical protein [Cyclobacteriaceae bacterium]